MQLTLARHAVQGIRLGDATCLRHGFLYVDPDALRSLWKGAPALHLDAICVTNPGESVRFGPVLDITGARCCAGGTAYPGFRGEAPCSSVIHVLDNVAVAMVANLPNVQEGFVETTPEASTYTPFADTFNLVISFTVEQGVDKEKADAAIRAFQLEVSEMLGGLGLDRYPEREERFVWPPPPAPSLPKVALVYFVQSQGAMRRTFVRGREADSMEPCVENPLDILAGIVVSGNYVLSCNKSCTWIHNEHPLVRALFDRHGRELCFSGVLMACERNDLEAKRDVAVRLSRLAVELGVDGVIINQEGGANSDMDLMLACKEMESAGIATVLLANEFAGKDGRTPSLGYTIAEAGWIVSTGNNEAEVRLPAVERFVGASLLAGLAADGRAAVRLPLTRVYASTNQLGKHTLSCVQR